MQINEWVESLKAAEAAPEGFTTRDLCRTLGIAERTVRERLRAAWDRGTLIRVGFRTEETMSGRSYRAPVYQFVGGKNGTAQSTSPEVRKDAKAAKARRR